MAGRLTKEPLLGALYRSLTELECLPEFLELVCKETHSHVGSVQTHDLATASGTLPTTFGMSVEAAMHYNERYAAHNVLIQRTAPILKTAAVILGDDVVSNKELRESIFTGANIFVTSRLITSLEFVAFGMAMTSRCSVFCVRTVAAATAKPNASGCIGSLHTGLSAPIEF